MNVQELLQRAKLYLSYFLFIIVLIGGVFWYISDKTPKSTKKSGNYSVQNDTTKNNVGTHETIEKSTNSTKINVKSTKTKSSNTNPPHVDLTKTALNDNKKKVPNETNKADQSVSSKVNQKKDGQLTPKATSKQGQTIPKAQPTPSFTTSKIAINYLGYSESDYDLIVKNKTSGTLTTYIPISEASRIFNGSSIKNSWDTQKWNLNEPEDMEVNMKLPKPTQTKLPFKIYINNQLVQTAHTIIHMDPRTKETTPYISLSDFENALKYLYYVSTWDGHTLTIQQWPTKFSLLYKLSSLGGSGGLGNIHNTFDDVSNNEMDIISSIDDVSNNKDEMPVPPDSSQHFGLNDPITLKTVDHALQLDPSWLHGFPQVQTLLPNQSTADWAKMLGINDGVTTTGYLTPDDFNKIKENLTNLNNGMIKVKSIDDYAPNPVKYKLFYSLDLSPSEWLKEEENVPHFEESVYLAYDFFNKVMFYETKGNASNSQGTLLIMSFPTFSLNSQWLVKSVKNINLNYSLDNGKTWTVSSSGLYRSDKLNDGGTANPPKRVLIKIPLKNSGNGAETPIDGVMIGEKGNGFIYKLEGVKLKNGSVGFVPQFTLDDPQFFFGFGKD